MTAALAALAKECRDLRIEKYHGFGCQRATLGGAERQYVDAAAPKCFFEELPKDTLVVGSLFLSLLSQFYRS